MCKGIQQENISSYCLEEGRGSTNANEGSTKLAINCELCDSRATLYCQADDAYLCSTCDKWVHEANFLARRHIRCFLCNTCRNLTERYLIGASREVMLPTMESLQSERRRCGSDIDMEGEDSTILRTPFLFL